MTEVWLESEIRKLDQFCMSSNASNNSLDGIKVKENRGVIEHFLLLQNITAEKGKSKLRVGEKEGRISGDKAWKSARGEDGRRKNQKQNGGRVFCYKYGYLLKLKSRGEVARGVSVCLFVCLFALFIWNGRKKSH